MALDPRKKNQLFIFIFTKRKQKVTTKASSQT